MKKILIVVFGALALSGSVSTASCILAPTSINDNGIANFALVDSLETGFDMVTPEYINVFINAQMPIGVSESGCVSTGDADIAIARQFITYVGSIDMYFHQTKALSPSQQMLFTTQAQNTLKKQIKARVEGYIGSLDLNTAKFDLTFLSTDPQLVKMAALLAAFTYYHAVLVDQKDPNYTLPTIPLNDENVTEVNTFDINTGTADLTQQMAAYEYIEGNALAPILLTEFADVGCIHCAQQFQDGTVASLLSTFPNQIKYAFKPVDVGYNASYQSKAMICAGVLGGKDAYIQMYKDIFADTLPVSGSLQTILPPEGKIDAYATSLQINTMDLRDCIASKGIDVTLE